MLDNQKSLKTYLLSNLNTSLIGKKIYYRKKLNSTMEYAKTLAKKGANEGTVIIADRQTAGKGRLGRIWFSPEGNIAMSVILHPPINLLHRIIMIASVAVVNAIRNSCDLECTIKWPNDVLINGKKVCGILIENEIKNYEINFTVIGIGINVSLNPSAFPEISAISTSLSNELGYELDRNIICANVLTEMERIYLNRSSDSSVYNEWKSNMEILGKTIRAQSGESIYQGIAQDVTEQGNLVIKKDDGNLTELMVGDITILK